MKSFFLLIQILIIFFLGCSSSSSSGVIGTGRSLNVNVEKRANCEHESSEGLDSENTSSKDSGDLEDVDSVGKFLECLSDIPHALRRYRNAAKKTWTDLLNSPSVEDKEILSQYFYGTNFEDIFLHKTVDLFEEMKDSCLASQQNLVLLCREGSADRVFEIVKNDIELIKAICSQLAIYGEPTFFDQVLEEATDSTPIVSKVLSTVKFWMQVCLSTNLAKLDLSICYINPDDLEDTLRKYDVQRNPLARKCLSRLSTITQKYEAQIHQKSKEKWPKKSF